MRTVAVIGGSGVYEAAGFDVVKRHSIDTPFGKPSDDIVEAKHGVGRIYFLARHGNGHRFLPTEVPYRANIFALKTLGVDLVVAVGAVGSLRQEIAPGDMVMVNQFIDRTHLRTGTFFGEGIVGHVSLADPTCLTTVKAVAAAIPSSVKVHPNGTYICMEGPQFSTRAESHMYRGWNTHVIGMTNLQEAKLCREAEMCYVPVSLVTDYDCWHESEEAVTVDAVLKVLHRNAANAQEMMRNLAANVATLPDCPVCTRSLDFSVITAPDKINRVRAKQLLPIFGRLNLVGGG